MANHETVSSALGGATITRPGVISNAPGGSPLNGATPSDNAIVYEGQKVPISIQTTDLSGDNYTEVQFYVAVDDEVKAESPNPDGVTGTALHPDSVGKLLQPVNQTQSDYGLNIVILGKAGEDATWNVSITGAGSNPPAPLKFTPNVHYSTRDVYISPLWGYQFLLPGDNTQPTAGNSLHIKQYQVMDEGQASLQLPFSARIALQAGSEQPDLTCLHFFDSNNQEIPLTADRQSVWIDSDDQGVLDFSVTANTPLTSWNLVTLTMHVGTASINLPGLIIVDLRQVPKDGQVDPPQIKGATGHFDVDPSGPPIGVVVPSTTLDRGQIKVNDTLFLAVNGAVLPETGRTVTPNDKELIGKNDSYFFISPSLLNYSKSGGSNTILFLIVRPENGAVKSVEFTFTAFGDEDAGGTVSPFPTGDQKFLPPKILEFGPDHIINLDDTEKGFTAKIEWASWKPEYQPALNEIITLYCLIAGYDRYSAFQPVILPLPAEVTQDDLNNGYIEVPIKTPSLRGWGVGPQGQNSWVIFQFKAGLQYSKPTGQYTLASLGAGGV